MLLSLLLTSFSTFANYGKPELMARFSDIRAWNAPDNTWCFSGEPTAVNGKVYLQCFDYENSVMMEFKKGEHQVYAKAKPGNFFSNPIISAGLPTWYESDELSVTEAYRGNHPVGIKRLGPDSYGTDNFIATSNGNWIYRYKGDSPELRIWKDQDSVSFFKKDVSFIFTPAVGPEGEIAIKTREVNHSESSPDKIWLHNGKEWKVVLEDKDSNPSSPWINFRNQLAVSGESLVTFSQDDKSEVLLLVSGDKTQIIARAGVDLKTFDYFAPKINGNTVLFRGVDFENRKVVYVFNGTKLEKLISQGDIVHTDLGDGRVHYQSQDSIFYGSPGFDEKGNIYLQATIVDDSSPKTLLGIGLIKFNRE